MGNNELISVITIFYNAEKYLQQAIDSVVNQTWTNWELILVNDASTDNSAAIAKNAEKSHPLKIRYLSHNHKTNQGISFARNLGLKDSRGKYIAFLDADDVYLPEKLKTQIHLLRQNPEIKMVYSASMFWYSWQKNPKQTDFIQKTGIKSGTIMPPRLLNLFLDRKAVVPCMGSVLADREALIALGGFENEFTGMFEDQVFYSKMACHYPVLVTNDYFDKYRQHSESTFSLSKTNNTVAQLYQKYLRWLLAYIDLNPDESVQNSVQNAIKRSRRPAINRLHRFYHKNRLKIVNIFLN